MTSQYKPAHYSTVSPYLVVNGADATIDFLKRVFDAIELRRFPDDSGKVMHAEVRIDDTVIMLADPVPPEWPPISANVHIYVRDVDATYRKALEAGLCRYCTPTESRAPAVPMDTRTGWSALSNASEAGQVAARGAHARPAIPLTPAR